MIDIGLRMGQANVGILWDSSKIIQWRFVMMNGGFSGKACLMNDQRERIKMGNIGMGQKSKPLMSQYLDGDWYVCNLSPNHFSGYKPGHNQGIKQP